MKKTTMGILLAFLLSGCASVENNKVASSSESSKSASKNKDCETTRKKTGSRLSRKVC